MAALILFVDALPHDHLARMPRLAGWPWQARVQPGFGYSINVHAELFAGLTPDQVGFFGEWTVDPEHAPARAYSRALPLLQAVLRPYYLNRGVQSLLTRRYRPGRLMPNLPLARLSDFALVGEKVTATRFPRPTLFTRHPNMVSVSAAGLRKGSRDEELVRRGRQVIDAGATRIFLPLPDLDGVGHAHGTSSSEWRRHLDCVDAWSDDLTAAFLARQPDGDVLLVSDHGMADVRAGIPFELEREVGPQSRQRYLYFTDSTIVRVWVTDPALEPQIAEHFARGTVATLVTPSERARFGLTRPGFGDFIAVLEEGVCFKPSMFARHIPTAMHGYHPDVSSQQAVLLHRGGHPPTAVVRRSLDVYRVLDEALSRE